jgi:iron complex transport system ATP-binding protein
MSTGLNISKLAAGHKKAILSNVDIQLGTTGTWPILGRNGTGKTTLLLTLANLLRRLDGEVLWNGEDIQKLSSRERAKLLSVVLTQQTVPGGLNVHTLVAMGRYPHLSPMQKASEEDEHAVAKAISTVGLQGFENRRMHELSDGERQKVLIARALCQDTAVMVLDEPTVYLDYVARKEIVDLLFELGKERLILFSTHNVEEIAKRACPVVLIAEGNASKHENASFLLT